MSGIKHWEQDKEATVYIGNIDERVSDHLIWELMLQAGRIINVHLPKDRVTQSHQGYGFVEFINEADADYAAKIMNQVRLYGKPIRVNKASADKQKTVEVGAELYVGNLDAMVDEKILHDTFSRFGELFAPPKVARDENGLSKCYGFVSYSNFEASDDAIANMNGQYLMNKAISVEYAYKKDGKGERHGDQAERMLAAQAKKHNVVPDKPGIPTSFLMSSSTVDTSALVSSMRGPVNSNFPGAPPQSRTPGNSALPPPPSGLPQRPPPSQAGYGGPQEFHPPGFAPPAGFSQMPPGFGPPSGAPPSLPPGFMPPPGFPPQQGSSLQR